MLFIIDIPKHRDMIDDSLVFTIVLLLSFSYRSFKHIISSAKYAHFQTLNPPLSVSFPLVVMLKLDQQKQFKTSHPLNTEYNRGHIMRYIKHKGCVALTDRSTSAMFAKFVAND